MNPQSLPTSGVSEPAQISPAQLAPAQIETEERGTVPQAGQLVSVRNRQWVVADVSASFEHEG